MGVIVSELNMTNINPLLEIYKAKSASRSKEIFREPPPPLKWKDDAK